MKSIVVQKEVVEDQPIGMQNLSELPVDAKELEALLEKIGAEVTHPIQNDPVATLNGKVVAFWTE